MAITATDYLHALRVGVPEARGLLDGLEVEDESAVWQVNRDLVHLLLWSWRSGDREVCGRILDVMELGLVDTDDDEDAPVWNSVGIGVVETVGRDLGPDDFAAFVETWPPALREIGEANQWSHLDFADEIDGEPVPFHLPGRTRLRYALRHPVRTRLGTRISFAG